MGGEANLKCRRPGCGQSYDPSSNRDDACRYHKVSHETLLQLLLLLLLLQLLQLMECSCYMQQEKCSRSICWRLSGSSRSPNGVDIVAAAVSAFISRWSKAVALLRPGGLGLGRIHEAPRYIHQQKQQQQQQQQQQQSCMHALFVVSIGCAVGPHTEVPLQQQPAAAPAAAAQPAAAAATAAVPRSIEDFNKQQQRRQQQQQQTQQQQEQQVGS